MKRLSLIVIIIVLLFLYIQAYAEQVLPNNISFEIKFLLEPSQVLTSNCLLTEAINHLFSTESEYIPIDVIYLETSDRSFNTEGWINRIRWKAGKKKPECTYKKRYPVMGNDPASILSTLEKAASDGIDVLSSNCTTQIDWSYSKLTLSLTWESSGKYKDYLSLKQFNTGDAISYFAKSIPEEENNWITPGWGTETLAHAQKVGITTFHRVKGNWEGTDVTFEIAAIPANGNFDYIVELSFKADDYEIAFEKQRQLVTFLEEKDLLQKSDSLKTQMILDAYLREKPTKPDCILPELITVVEAHAFQGCHFQYVWGGNKLTTIQSEAFAECPYLQYIRFPETITSIDEDALPDPDISDLCIIGVPGSAADRYANDYNYDFIPE